MSARRTVSVALEVKAAEARKQIRGASDDVRKLEASVVAADRGLDKMSDKAAKAGRGAEKAAAGTKTAKVEAEAYKRELGQLDRQIDATVLHLKVLGREFANTGDKAVLKQISAERAMLRRLQQIRKDLMPNIPAPPVGAVGGGGGGLAAATPALIGSLVAIAAAALPAIGAAVGGAVLGGIGTGGIIGGIAAASQDDRVRRAATRFGESFMTGLRDSGDPFIQPLVDSLGESEETGASLTATLHSGFTKLAPVIGPLTKGVEGLFRGIDRGLDAIFNGPAQKALRALANELPEVGNAIGDAMESISDSSDGATMGLIELLHIVEGFIRGSGQFIAVLSDIFEWEVKLGYGATSWGDSWLRGIQKVTDTLGPFGGNIGIAVDQYRGFVQGLNDEDASLIEGLHKASDAANDWNGSLRDLRDTTQAEVQALRDLNDAMEKQLGIVLGLPEAQIRFNQQWADTVETLHEGKRSLDITTEAGRDHKQALIDLIRAADGVKQAEYDKTGSLDAATQAYDRQLERIRKMARDLGYDKKAVDDLIDSVKTGNLLGGLTVPVTMPGLATYTARLNYYIQRLGVAKGLAAAEFATYREGERSLSRNRWGGAYTHAASGLLREASYYSAANPGRYMIAEPATRGEAFIPKSGNYGRSMAILGQAAGWYGASVVPGGYVRSGGGGTTTVVHEHRHVLVVEGTGMLSGIRREITLLGGDVQSALGSRTRVGG